MQAVCAALIAIKVELMEEAVALAA